MSNITNITVTNVTADTVLTLKPKQFWELPSDVLTAVAPLLRAKAKAVEAEYRAWQSANPNRSHTPDNIQALWDLRWKCDEWAEKAERLPKKRIEDAAKAERAKAKTNKAKDQKERVRYLTPATTLIAESLVSVRDHIASRKFAALNGVAKSIRAEFVKYVAANPVEVKTVRDYTFTTGKTWTDFWSSLDRSTRLGCIEFNAERVLLVEEEDTYRKPAAERTLKAEHLTERSLQAEAKSYADLVVGSYAYRVADRTAARHQVATKENKAAITSCVSDNKTIWDGAIITVTCGSHQYRFSTSCIVNFSKYGKAFNQWPTREIASSHEDEANLEKWSA